MATLCTGWQLSMIEVDREVIIIQEEIIFNHFTGKRSHFTLAASSRFEDTRGILSRLVQRTDTVNVWVQVMLNGDGERIDTVNVSGDGERCQREPSSSHNVRPATHLWKLGRSGCRVHFPRRDRGKDKYFFKYMFKPCCCRDARSSVLWS